MSVMVWMQAACEKQGPGGSGPVSLLVATASLIGAYPNGTRLSTKRKPRFS